MKLEGKVVVVTGGGNGIGRELVLQALARGARVAAADLRADSLAQLAASANAGERLSTHTLDVSDRASVDALPAQVLAHHGAVDVVINNAGIVQPFAPIAELSRAAIDRVINVNLHGTFNMVTTFLPLLLARPEAHIANLSSMGAFLPVPGQAIYCATKAAVRLMSEGLYAELVDTHVGVSVVMPGAIGTDIVVNSGVPVPAIAKTSAPTTSPASAARAILNGIERNQLHILIGLDARILNWATRLAPKQTIQLIQKQLKGLLSAKPQVAT